MENIMREGQLIKSVFYILLHLT